MPSPTTEPERLPLQWGDVDALGHANNALDVRYVESDRISDFDELTEHDPATWGGEGPILAEVQCTFLSQLRYRADMEVATRTARLGGKSMTVLTRLATATPRQSRRA